jgi:peptidoglycan hydrolase-like protein with peptidoglycan-binding domain
MAGQAMGVELEKYRSTPSLPGGGIEAQEEGFQPLNRSQVQEMQRILSQKGFDPGDVDGYIGPDTQEAIREFQRSEGLAVTGNPNEQTLRALAPPEKHEFFGLAPEFEGETQHPEGTRSMERY